MCKLFVVAGPLTKKQVHAALAASNDCFAKGESDGFGFIAGNKEKVARGRYLDPDRFYGFGELLPDFLGGPTIEEGVIPELTQSLIVHGRTSTNVKGLDNVHPFRQGNMYLAHNGIVHYKGEGTKPSPACDSEQFLHWLCEDGRNWHEAYDNWQGSGAVITYQGGLLTVAKDMASLFIAKRANRKGWVFATIAEQLVKICHKANIGLATRPIMFPIGRIMQLEGRKMVNSVKWKGFSAWSGWTPQERQSGTYFGYQNKEKEKHVCLRETESFPDYDGGEKLPSCSDAENASLHSATVEALSLSKTDPAQGCYES